MLPPGWALFAKATYVNAVILICGEVLDYYESSSERFHKTNMSKAEDYYRRLAKKNRK